MSKTMLLRRLGSKLYSPFTPKWLDRGMFDFIPKGDDANILNVGSGSTPHYNNRTINTDIKKWPNVDIVADAHSLPFPDTSFDCVIANAVLEHTIRPWIVASEIQRVLRREGVAIIQAPFLEAVHDESDYFRFTQKGLRSLFPELDEIKSGISGSSVQIVADMIREWPVLLVENTWMNLPMTLLMSWLAKPLQHMDWTVRNRPSMPKYARATYFVGRKR